MPKFVTGRPARSAAMPVLFLLTGPKMGFLPRRGNTLRRSAPPCQLSRLLGCGNTAPKTVNISNFCQKFVPQGQLICNIFRKFSAFVRVYR